MKRVLMVLGIAVLAAWQTYAVHRDGAETVQGRIYVVTALVALLFMWLYNRDPWQKTWFGRSLMLIAVAVFLIGLSVVLFRLFGPGYPGRDVLLIVSADAACAAIIIRTAVLWAAQRRDEHKADPRP